MLSGENSILNKAGQARDVTGQRDIEERIKIAYLGAMANGKGSFSRDKFVEELDKTFGEGKYTLSTDGSTIKIDGKDYETGLPGKWSKEEKIAMTSNNITEVTGNDIANANLKDENKIKAVIKDEDNAQIPIPVDAEYVEGKESTGVVIKYKDSEFVWVPVPVAITSSAPSTTRVDLAANPTTERPMAILQSGSETNYQGILYGFSGTKSTANSIESVTGDSGYREPAYLTDKYIADASSYNTVGITQDSLQGEYNSVVASIAKYGGFYVGRYELGLEGEGKNPVSKPASDVVTTANSINTGTDRWYGLYSKCKSFSAGNLTSTMMWGSQYDAMMNWMAKTGKTVGTTDNGKTNQNQTTGSKEEDIINNVKDLYGCHFEWTLEALGRDNRVLRGGRFGVSYSPSLRNSDYPTYTLDYNGSRLSLYINV